MVPEMWICVALVARKPWWNIHPAAARSPSILARVTSSGAPLDLEGIAAVVGLRPCDQTSFTIWDSRGVGRARKHPRRR